jgi:hypothetical protein
MNLHQVTANTRNAPAWMVAWMRSKDDPYLFVTGVLGILPYGDPNPDNKPQLEKWQQTVLKAVAKNDRISIRSGHGVGKGAMISWLVLWALLTHNDVKVPVAANSQNQLRDNNWPEIAKWRKLLPEPLKEKVKVQSEKIFITSDPDSAFAVRRTCTKENSEALQGLRGAFSLYLIDEASGIPDIIFEVAQGALSSPGAKAILFSNPTRTSGFFFDTHNRLRHRWRCFHVNSEDVPRATGHIQDIIESYGKGSNKYRVRVLGEFPTKDDETVIPLELVLAAQQRKVEKLKIYPVWGLDVARFGDDSCALAKRQGNRLMEPIREWRDTDTMQTAGIVMREYQTTHVDERPHEILVDVIGLGAGVVDRLKELNLPVRGINVGEAPAADDHYMRLRDELWFRGREWFQARDCSFPIEDEKTVSELINPTYDFHSSGRIVVESKKDMKKRGVPSPNRADAFLLTLATGMDRRVKAGRRWGKSRKKTSGWSA